DIARSHHERYDGTGYPDRLLGDAIPLCARIVTLADVYDALTSKRVYKDAFSHDVARAIILGESGTQFDPRIVTAFQESEATFISIRSRYLESRAAAA
ncbi:MAG: HD domain-containing protein, partial [Phycisphaerae bacterium]|nr:HD domain-containing protein [Phycisphaerae bacterium]